MALRWIVLILFAAVYLFLCLSRRYRATGVWTGLGLMVLSGFLLAAQDTERALSPGVVLFKAINWNVIGVLAGAMLIADLFLDSGVPILLADWIVNRCRTARMALLSVCALAGLISSFMENATTVLLVAPVALAVARRTRTSPVPLLIGVAVCANLQGAAMLFGDPQGILLAGFYRLRFNDFFVLRGRPYMFFAMQAGAAFGLLVLYFIFRRFRHAMAPIEVKRPNTWVPAFFILAMVSFLAVSSFFDPGFAWLAGAGNVILAAGALAWAFFRNPADARRIVRNYHFPTLLFLAGIFAMAYEMQRFGWMRTIADGIAGLVGRNEFAAYSLIVWGSVLLCAFVDSVAYIALMLPVTQFLETNVGGSRFLYAGGLLVGACLGGNITPFGADTNIVACGILHREGCPVSFWRFVRIGLPFTLAATTAGYIFLWVFWHS